MPYVYGSNDNDITWDTVPIPLPDDGYLQVELSNNYNWYTPLVFRGKPGKIYTIEMEFVEEGVLVRVK